MYSLKLFSRVISDVSKKKIEPATGTEETTKSNMMYTY